MTSSTVTMIVRHLRRPRELPAKLVVVVKVAVLWSANRVASRRAVDPGGDAVVSLTSHGARLRDVHLTLESIAWGAERPARLVLWVADERWPAGAERSLRRLARRGVEVRRTVDVGPHTKYFPAVLDPEVTAGRTLVTADDDILYPRGWLRDLLREARRTPDTVVALRAHEISMTGSSVDPYSRWRARSSDEPSPLVFPTGVAGVAYPVVMQEALRSAGDGFLAVAPRADDVWLHAVAVRAGVPIRQAFERPRDFPGIPGSQRAPLFAHNVLGGGNDEQVVAVHGRDADVLHRAVDAAGARAAARGRAGASVTSGRPRPRGIRATVARIPVLGPLARSARRAVAGRRFAGSQAYWVERYERGGDSGAGSYARLAEAKATVLNAFVEEHQVTEVVEFGCGDGNQLVLARYPRYTGYDISPDAIRRCRARFADDPTKSFHLVAEHDGRTAELALSLDVVYHLVEDATFEDYMARLFDSAERFVAVYSSNVDAAGPAPHVRHRHFTRWVEEHRPDWHQIAHVPNPYPFDGDERDSSFADFYFFGRR